MGTGSEIYMYLRPDCPLRIPRSGADDGPEQLALVGLGMVFNAVHVARGYTEHITGRQQKSLGCLGQKLRVALVGIGQSKLQCLRLAARHIEYLTAKADGFGILDTGGGQIELTGDPTGEVTDTLLVESLRCTGDDLALLLAALG